MAAKMLSGVHNGYYVSHGNTPIFRAEGHVRLLAMLGPQLKILSRMCDAP